MLSGAKMSNEDTTAESDYLSPKDIQKWLLQEMRDSAKAHELRVTEATELATAYALGQLTPEQAHERFLRHDHRWGEALPGTHAFKGSTDEQILAAIDKTRGEFTPPRQVDEEFQKRFGKRGERGGPPSR
jgi:hypothetical protein